MLLALLSSVVTAALPAPIVFAEPLGPEALRLGAIVSGRSARACNQDTIGVAATELGARPLFRIHGELAVHLGPRAIGKARVTDVQAYVDAKGRCHLVATALLDARVPLLGRNDVLWVSQERWPSVTRKAAQRGALRSARVALEGKLRGGCEGRDEAVLRASSTAAWVGITCRHLRGSFSALVRVPKKGAAEVVLLESAADERAAKERARNERLTLLDVLDPNQQRRNLVVLAREVGATRTLELWQVGGGKARRLSQGLPKATGPQPAGAM